MDPRLETLSAQIAELDPTLYPLFSVEFGDAVMAVERSLIPETMMKLRELGFDRLGMVTAVDRGSFFVMVYRLTSTKLRAALFVKTKVPRHEPHIDSVYDVWPAADWQEREVYDMFGITFLGHPDLKRILLPDEFVGYPQRKDYEDPNMIRRPDYI